MPHLSAFAQRLPALALICAVVTVCGCNSYSATSEREALKQKEAGFSGAVSVAGGSAKKEGRKRFGIEMTGWMVDLSGAEISDELMDELLKVGAKDPVFSLNLSKSKITNEQLVKLGKGKVLQKTFELDLSDTAISDTGLDGLSNFYCLSDLKLKGSKATKAAATRLGKKQMSHPDTPAPLKKQPKVDI
jgi:hypothetical protein